MSVKVTAWAWEHSEALDLTPPELLVLLCLGDHANHDGTGARPGAETIAGKTRLSRATVKRGLRSLRARGVIEPETGTRGGRGRRGAGNVTSYRFPLYIADSKGLTVSPLEGRQEGGQDPRKGVTVTPLEGEERGSQRTRKGLTEDQQGAHRGPPHRRTVLNRPEPPPPARTGARDGAPTAPAAAGGGGGGLSSSQEQTARAVLASRHLALGETARAVAAATPGVLGALWALVAEAGEEPERVAWALAKADGRPLREAHQPGAALLSRIGKARGLLVELKSKSGQDGAPAPGQVEAARAPSPLAGPAGEKPEQERPRRRAPALADALRRGALPVGDDPERVAAILPTTGTEARDGAA